MRFTVFTVIALMWMTAMPAGAFFGFFDSRFQTVQAVDGMVRIDASRVKPGVANFFALQDAGRTVRFFVVRDERGAVRAALDACTTCWKAGKGYAFDVNAMMCLTCKRRFTFSRIGMFKEGCNPYPLTIQQTLEKVVLSAHELLSGSRYFPDTP